MLIVSWNVAGLKPALQKINTDYGSSGNNGKSKPSSSSSSSTNDKNNDSPFAKYLQLHGNIDILCLQEHKIPFTQLSSRSEPYLCSSIPGYESFWSCATDAKARGFNGVCTYVKTGLVKGADCTPLQDPELDNQGRCIMTDHGSFVLFNVYVPCGGDEETLPRKMKFLNALHTAMEKQRGLGKDVILVGDMNAKVDKRDIDWKFRSVNVDEIILSQQQSNDGSGESAFPAWKRDIASKWGEIKSVLQTIEVSTAAVIGCRNILTGHLAGHYSAALSDTIHAKISLGNATPNNQSLDQRNI